MKKINTKKTNTKRTKNIMSTLTIIGIVLAMSNTIVFATTNEAQRLSGSDRYQTAVKVSNAGWVSANTAIICSGEDSGLVDALSVSPFAGQENVPILLTKNNSLNLNTKAELVRLGIKKVYIIGAVNDSVANEVKNMGISIEVIRGTNRIATADKVNSMLKSPNGTFIVGYDALADSISVASYAIANNYAIVLANSDGSIDTSKLVGTKKYIIGGTGVVNDIPGVERISGLDRFATNKAVLNKFIYKYDKIYVANGKVLADALVIAPVAGRYNAPILLSDGQTIKAASDINSKLTSSSDIFALGGTGVLSDSVISQLIKPIIPASDFAVKTIANASTSSFKVTFNVAPLDTSKVLFTLKNGTTSMPTVVSWDATNTIATLTSSSTLPYSVYTVDITNGDKKLATQTISVDAQKAGTIKITSTTLNVAANGIGYATYKEFDQYGVDITNTYLGNSLTFQCSLGTVEANDGLLKVTPNEGTNLFQFPTVVISGFDLTNGIATNATLTVSKSLGTLSSLKLASLSTGNSILSGDVSSVWTIPYTATDMSGNPTTNFDLIKAGLFLGTNNEGDCAFTSSSQDVMVNLVRDTTDNSKAVIQIVVSSNVISFDMPVTINAITYSGTTSSLAITLKALATANTFSISAPSEIVSVGKQVAIPFSAQNQSGTQITNYDDLMAANIKFSPAGVGFSKNSDGTASLLIGPFANKGIQVISAMTSTGKYSSITINVQDTATPETLTLNSAVIINSMQKGAIQNLDFGLNYGGFAIKDQYGNNVNMTSAPGNYEIHAVASGNVSATGIAYGGNSIELTASSTAGQGRVTFNLVDKTNPTKILASASINLAVLDAQSIKGYTLDAVSQSLYAIADTNKTSTTLTDRESGYAINPYVYGTTASGAKVILAGTPIVGVFVDNTTDFIVDTTNGDFPFGYKGIYVVAKKLDSARTSATGNLTVTINGADGTIKTLTKTISSSSIAPVATSINVFTSTTSSGITVNQAGDQVTVDIANAPDAFAKDKILTRFNKDGQLPTAGRAEVYFYAVDQYGKKAMPLTYVYSQSTLNAGDSFNVDSDGTITDSKLSAGDVITLTTGTSNNLSKIIKITIK